MDKVKKYKNLAILFTGGIVLSSCGHNYSVEINTNNDKKSDFIVSDNAFSVDDSSNLNIVTTSADKTLNVTTSVVQTYDEPIISSVVQFSDEPIISTVDVAVSTVPVYDSTFKSIDTTTQTVSDFSVNSTSLIISSSIDYDNIIGNACAEVVQGTTTTAISSVDESDMDICSYNKMRYSYESDVALYTIADGDTLDIICDTLSMTTDQILSLNPNFYDLGVGDQIGYPIKNELYHAKEGETLNSVFLETGVSVDELRNLNNISDQTMVLSKDTSLLIHIFKGNETSYVTPFGVSNVYFDNKIWADKLVIATGFSGASQKVLALNCSRFNHGLNSATMYCFDGASSYTSSCIARNVRDVDLLDGYPVAYTRNMNDLSLLAEEVGLPLTEDLYEKWCTCYLDDYSIDTDVNGNEYVYYNSYFKGYIKK